ncbi:unnamed protein product [Somion occarium]|uniref:EXPERA domain-containing protein n=2 Tax=Somion occarium TaxID=3059160 RepID=A0ABP1DVN6_9APHY
MYTPLLSAGLANRFEREMQEHLSTKFQHNRQPESVEIDEWESVLDARASSTVSSSSTTSSHEWTEKEESRGQKTEQNSKLSSNGALAGSHALWSWTMAVNARTWISLWFLLTIPVIFWDAGYCFLRPRSMKGGDLHWIWKPYELYQEVDYVYGTHALERGDGFTNAQSLLNIVENFMNIGYLYLAHIVESPVAPLLGFASAVMTLSKTVLYWAQEYYCGGCAVGHNDLKTLIVYWIIPNGLWLVVPSFIIVRLAKDIASSLRTADQVAKKDKLGKRL